MKSDDLTVEVLTQPKQFAGCRELWNELAGDQVFQSWEWMSAWWETIGCAGPAQLAILVVRDSRGRCLGIAPWFKTISASRGRVVRTLGSGTACSDYVGMLVRNGFHKMVGQQLARAIVGSGNLDHFQDVDLFEFEGHPKNELALKELRSEASSKAARLVCEEHAATWRCRLTDSWESFESKLSKSFRRKTRKAQGRLQSDSFRGKSVHSLEQIERLWPVFVDLHQRRRNALGQDGCFAEARFEEFLKLATLRLAQAGRANLHVVEFNDRAITANLEFLSGDSVYMYQTGVDPQQMQLEPGHLVFTYAIQQAIQRHFTSFDFLRGDEPYKAKWNTERVPLYRTRIIPYRWQAQVRDSLVTAGHQLGSWAKQLKPRWEN